MKISHSHLAALMEHGTVTIRDDEHQPDDARFRTAGEAASLDMLGVALARLDRSAARQRPPRCADCTEDLPEHHHHHNDLCDECAARRHELQAA